MRGASISTLNGVTQQGHERGGVDGSMDPSHSNVSKYQYRPARMPMNGREDHVTVWGPTIKKGNGSLYMA